MQHARSLAVLFTLILGSACGDEGSGSDGGAGSPGSGGSTASGGSAGSAGSPSAGGAGGSGSGAGGSISGSAGSAGAAAGSGGGAGESGSGGSAGSGGQASTLGFFATSKGSGDLGGNLGGLEGADGICQSLAAAVGAGDRTWRAYLSTSTADARDRIGDGPWFNANGDMVGADVASIHLPDPDGLSNGDPQHVLDENGDEVPAAEHDILTGSLEDGTVADGATCADWTSASSDDVAQVGHSDIPAAQFSPRWNSAHESAGCDPAGLVERGGAGRLYCFAAD